MNLENLAQAAHHYQIQIVLDLVVEAAATLAEEPAEELHMVVMVKVLVAVLHTSLAI